MMLAQASRVAGDVADFFSVDFADGVRLGLRILAILALWWIAKRVLKALTGRLERSASRGDGTTMEIEQRSKTLAQLLNSVGNVVIALAAILTILNQFITIGPLLAGVGVVGLAISFGAQSLVKDIITGFFILLENQFQVDDIVEINGTGGRVEQMTMRVVMLRDLKGVLHVIPNGNITMVSNRTRGFSRAVVDVSVAYKENVDHVMEILRDVEHEMWEDEAWRPLMVEEPAVLGVDELADSAVLIRIVAPTRPGRQFEVARELRRRIKNRFDKEGIEIPFPQRTIHMAKGS